MRVCLHVDDLSDTYDDSHRDAYRLARSFEQINCAFGVFHLEPLGVPFSIILLRFLFSFGIGMGVQGE